eukprot:854542_1
MQRMIRSLLTVSWLIQLSQSIVGMKKALLLPESIVTITDFKHPHDPNITREMNQGFGMIAIDDASGARYNQYAVKALHSNTTCFIKPTHLSPVGQLFIHDFTNEDDVYRDEFIKFVFVNGNEHRGNMIYFPSTGAFVDPLVWVLSQHDDQGRFRASDHLLSTFAKCKEFMNNLDTKNDTQIIEFLTFQRFICVPEVMSATSSLRQQTDADVWMLSAELYRTMTDRYGLEYPVIHNKAEQKQINAFNEASKRITQQRVQMIFERNSTVDYQSMFERMKLAIIKASDICMEKEIGVYQGHGIKIIDREYNSLVMADIASHWFRWKGGKGIHIVGFDLQFVEQFRRYFGETLKREFTTARIPDAFALGKGLVKVVHHPYVNNTPSIRIQTRIYNSKDT